MTRAMAVILGGILFCISGVSAAEDETIKIPMSFYEGPNVLKLIWPQRSIQRIKLRNTITAYDNKVSITNRGKVITLTCGSQSFKKTYTDKAAFALPGKLGEQERQLPIVLGNLLTTRQGSFVTVFPGWLMKGDFGKKTVCLIDANCDGKFDTSGNDCIAVDSKYAIRLSEQTSIDGVFYRVEVTPDGSELTLKKFTPDDLGRVALYKGFAGWQVLTLQDDKATYNIIADKCDVIPAGKYKIGYGVFGGGPCQLALMPGNDFDPELDIRKYKLNIINIGAPFSLCFRATFAANTVTIEPDIKIVGCYGEAYTYHSNSIKNISSPAICVYENAKTGIKPQAVSPKYS